MISEQDKQAILNGALGITSNDLKCKIVERATSPNLYYKNLLILYTDDGRLKTTFVSDDLRNADLEIVGLWQDKPEPFDLQLALAGKPLIDLHNNEKCWLYKSHNNGKLIIEYENEYDGESDLPKISFISEENNLTDCFGMWKDPEPQLSSNSLQLPKPLDYYPTEKGDYHMIMIKDNKFYPLQVHRDEIIQYYIDNRRVYASKEDAIKVIEAITGKQYKDRYF